MEEPCQSPSNEERRSQPCAVTASIPRGYNYEMRHLALILIIAAALSACGDIAVGPVDHSCPSNPAKSQGSGCEDSGDGGGGSAM
jgi:hypothetical protein